MKMKSTEEATPEVKHLLEKQVMLLSKHSYTVIDYKFTGVELWLIHGLVCLAAEHPGIKNLCDQSQKIIREFRDFCQKVWVDQGMTPQEARKLDELREEYAEEKGDQEL